MKEDRPRLEEASSPQGEYYVEVSLYGRPLPAFCGCRGWYPYYDRIHGDGIRHLHVEPEILYGFRGTEVILLIDAWFDPDVFDVRQYGFPSDDAQLIEGLTKVAASAIGLVNPTELVSMEQGAQTSDRICLEGGNDWLEHFREADLEHVSRISLSPEVEAVRHELRK